MNKLAIFIAAALLLLSAGGSISPIGNSDAQSTVLTYLCTPGVVTITHVAAGGSILKVHPKRICVKRGDQITLKIVPPQDTGNVSTKPEGSNPGSDHWLNKTNAVHRGKIVIDVPEDATLGLYKYSVTISGVGTLDPYAEVIP